ncbi:TetR/AcrR family transcriptional regulator [Roseivivax isoporae]|uniref:HTH tetR-type domain-containing protein n=1 Tax=Roseivivax isoporae LMG 25204 TaxID=1449351 RepID=X7F8Z9_9RHOB|nr:TetR/AcrR family transcriptional regulator [Roseivivax isoporae]ETX28556.1 hypothetical protein RISW2_05550 [Roseivivax isoporae LMG 25204]
MDIRRRRTRLRLDRALKQLLSERPLADVSVGMLCKRAGVTRQTFYDNYGGIPQMLDAYLTLLLSEIEARHARLMDHPPPEETAERMRALAQSVFADIDPADARLRALFDGVPGLAAERRFAALVEGFLERGDPCGDALLEPDARRVHAHFFTGAFIGLLRLWVSDASPRDPALMAHYFTSLALGGRFGSTAPHTERSPS